MNVLKLIVLGLCLCISFSGLLAQAAGNMEPLTGTTVSEKERSAFAERVEQKFQEFVDISAITADESLPQPMRQQAKQMVRDLFPEGSFTVVCWDAKGKKYSTLPLEVYLDALAELSPTLVPLKIVSFSLEYTDSEGWVYLLTMRASEEEPLIQVRWECHLHKVPAQFDQEKLKVWKPLLGSMQIEPF